MKTRLLIITALVVGLGFIGFVEAEESSFCTYGSHVMFNHDIIGKINSICHDYDSNSVIISIDSAQYNNFIVDIPRKAITAGTSCDEDASFIVLDNGEEIDYSEIKTTDTLRRLSISLSKDVHEIEIFGTFVGSLPDCKHYFESNRMNITPLQQSKLGISPQHIICEPNLELIMKSNLTSVCVKPETKEKLIERGWMQEIRCHGCDSVKTFDNYKINCDNQTNPYQEYECFKDAHSNCDIATVNPEIYTIEGDPIYTTLTITSDCKIRGIADMSTDQFWGTPEIIITQCDKISRNEHTWSATNCDAHNLSEMQFNFEMQLYPQILECQENGDTWIREKLECVRDKENEK